MSTWNRKLSKADIRQAFADDGGARFPPVLTPRQLAALLQLSIKTIYGWINTGRLNGAFRKRGKHILIWRDRAVNILFNGKEW